MITRDELQAILQHAAAPVVEQMREGRNIQRVRLLARKAMEDVLWPLRNVRTLTDFKVIMRLDGQRHMLKVVVLTWDASESLLVSELTFTATLGG